MECIEARKKLREYAVDEIHDKVLRMQIEEHVNGCPVCKRELLMWQDLTEKQAAISRMQARLPKELKDRIKYRMQKNEKKPDMPPMIKKLQSFGGKSGLILVFIMICIGLIFVLKTAKFTSILVPMFIFMGFAILFLLLLFRVKRKP